MNVLPKRVRFAENCKGGISKGATAVNTPIPVPPALQRLRELRGEGHVSQGRRVDFS